jgi:threonine dehydratase
MRSEPFTVAAASLLLKAPCLMPPDYLQKILTAKVYDVAIESPLQLAPQLSARLRHTVLLKREDLQPVFSFKLRGAYNKMAQLTAAQLKRGVICASAGNHAQGVALAAQKLGTTAVIVMPTTTPPIKIHAVAARGGTVVLHGASFDEACAAALLRAKTEGLTFIHPYDDPEVIAGQGTVAMEILRQHQGKLDAIFVAIGGGGLIGGIAAYVKRLRPEIKIIGVEPVDAASMHASLKAKRRVTLPQVGLFADGVAVKRVGKEGFRLAQKYVDEVVLCDTDAICAALKDVFEDTRAILEPAGALAIAGMKQYAARQKRLGQTFVAVACGANMNFDRLRFVAERAELGEQREAVFAATIPERPGSFSAFLDLLGERQITEFNYRYATQAAAHVFVGVTSSNRRDMTALYTSLKQHGIATLDLHDNEMAKLHVRHMVGGRTEAPDEKLLRFEFPERPGALRGFLHAIGGQWNISLFHYRNHGADYGRVLCGLQVPPAQQQRFAAFLRQLGYPYHDETANPAYRLFL